MPISLTSVRWRALVWRSRLWNSLKIFLHAPVVFSNWPYFLVSRLQNRTGVLRLRNGLEFWIRPRSSDRASISENYILHPYTLPERQAVVVDIGANIGAFTLRASAVAKTVYALEPVSSNFEMLRKNCELNGTRNIVAERIAISSSEGTCEMSVNGVLSSMFWDGPRTATEKVATTTLESFMNAHELPFIDFVKMDCEGAEWDILLGTPSSTLRRIGHLELEYHHTGAMADPAVLVNHLRDSGFDKVSASGGSPSGTIIAIRSKSAVLVSQLP